MDLSNVKKINYLGYNHTYISESSNTTFVLDDNNKYFNIPLKIDNLYWRANIEWKGTGPFTYDYLFINMKGSEYQTNYNVPVYSHNN